MIDDTQRDRHGDADGATIDDEGATAAERAGGDGAMFRQGADGTTGGADAEAGAGALGTSATGDLSGGGGSGAGSSSVGGEADDSDEPGNMAAERTRE